MLDTFDLPFPANSNIQIFYANSTVSNGAWQAWKKPRGVDFVYIFAVGGGAGGGGGATGLGANAGNAGSSAAKHTALYLANDIPDILYCSVGFGGLGSPAGTTTSTTGLVTTVATQPVNSIFNALVVAQPGTAAAGGTATTTTSCFIAGLSIGNVGTSGTTLGVAGVQGILGSATQLITGASGNGTTATLTYGTTSPTNWAVGQQIIVSGVNPTGYNGTYTVTAVTTTSVSYANTTTAAYVSGGSIQGQKAYPSVGLSYLGLTPGGTGGSTNSTAGLPGINGADIYNPAINTNISGIYKYNQCLGGAGGVTATSNGENGSNGYQIPGTLLFYGGAGGGSSGSTSGTGGIGGKGSYGCGGGGGGAGRTAGGRGGDGGDGLVIIVAW